MRGRHDQIKDAKSRPRRRSLTNGRGKNRRKLVSLIGGGYFEVFEWMPEEYQVMREIDRVERRENKEKRERLHKRDFLPVSPLSGGKQNVLYVDGNEYDALKEKDAAAKQRQKELILAGAFLPAGNDRTLERPNKSKGPTIVISLKQILAADWPSLRFLVALRDDDYIEVAFDTDSPDFDEEEVSIYMNALPEDERIAPFLLNRKKEEWKVQNENMLLFCLRPPWLKH
eukprot:TRINITY_DN4215_c0_g1_i1.p1 TRINITY_DN4215_c0_g1~~TRINITY_DN4215_c0_g1_i1.p1  ORF type:complete len:228 (-),score=37.23 TRINITY_DN4215_c0_g1_i1:100-783(-)